MFVITTKYITIDKNTSEENILRKTNNKSEKNEKRARGRFPKRWSGEIKQFYSLCRTRLQNNLRADRGTKF